MIEAKIDATDLDQLLKKLSDSPGVVKAARQKAFEDAAPKLKQALDAAIGGTGKVQSWQEQSVGSRGGYAAVRPKKQTYTQTNGKGKRYAVGYVTNAINTGHRFPAPSGKARYKPRIRSGRQNVPGLQFYERAEAQVPAIAQDAAEQVAQALIEHMEE